MQRCSLRNYTMKLPAVCLASTPLLAPCATPPARQARCLMVAPLVLPILSTATHPLTGHLSIPRLNPLHPPMVCKRTVSLETPAVHHHNHQRTVMMQRKELYRYHQFWRKPFYGTSAEREEYRKETREQLKSQMEERGLRLRLQQAGRAREAERLREQDRLALTSEREERIQHSRAMTVYRDENKKLMEQSWRDRALTRSQEALREREMLRLNPINWSGTLK